MNEVWKVIPDWPKYEASSLGRIRRSETRLVLRLNKNPKGYQIIGLSNNGKRSTVTVAKAVASAFIGPRPDGLQINHIDGVKTNNRPENLEYCTATENNRHAFRLGLNRGGKYHGTHTHPERRPFGERQGLSVLTEAQVVEIRQKYQPGKVGYKTLAVEYGVDKQTVCHVIRRRTWKHI